MIKRVLAVGDVNIDLVLAGLSNIPRPEQETVAQDMRVLVGGQTATLARALCALGVTVAFVGRVGNDDYGRMALAQLANEGVDVSAVAMDPTVSTGVTVVLSTGAERALATYPGTIPTLTRADVRPEFLHTADHLHVGSYFLQKGLQPDMAELFTEAKRLGLTTSVDPGWDPFGDWDTGLGDLLRHVDVFLPNAVEAMMVSHTDTPAEALEVLTGHANTVVIKLGGEGCLAGHRHETLSLPAFKTPVLDVTSAGDIFNSGFIYGYLSGWDLKDAARLASACGAISVSRIGTTGMMCSTAEVQDFLAGHGARLAPLEPRPH